MLHRVQSAMLLWCLGTSMAEATEPPDNVSARPTLGDLWERTLWVKKSLANQASRPELLLRVWVGGRA